MAEEQADLNLGKVSLTPTVQGGGRFATVIPKTPTTNSALRLSSGLANFSTVLGQYSNIQIKRGAEKAAAMSTEDVIAAMENRQKDEGIPVTERIGFQRGYAEGLYSRYLEVKTIPRLNDLSLELQKLNADEINAKDINEFDEFLESKIKAVEEETLQYVNNNPFQMMIHGAVFDPVKTKFAMQERAKFADKQNAWATSREEESIGTTLSNALRALPDLEKEGKDIKRLATDEINRVIGGFEQNSLQLNIPAANKPKMIQRGVLRAVKEFVNDPTINKVDKFDIARDFLDAARTTGFGKFKHFGSISGREAITQGYGIIDSAEKAFTDKNKTFTKDIIESNPAYNERLKHFNLQKAGEAEGDPLDTAEFMIDNLEELAVEIGVDEDPRAFNVLSDLTHDLYDKIEAEREQEIAVLTRNTQVGDTFTRMNNPNALIERLYDKYEIESTGETPLFTTYSIPGAYGAPKGQIDIPTPIVANKLLPFVQESAKNIDLALEPQVRSLLKDRSLSAQEKRERVKVLAKEIEENEVKNLEERVKRYISQIIPPDLKPKTAAQQRESAIKEIAQEKAITEDQAEILLNNQIAKEPEEVFKTNKEGKLDTNYYNIDALDGMRIGKYSIFDAHINNYNEVLQNSQNKGVLLGKPEAVDKAFSNLRILRQNNTQGLRKRATEYLQSGKFFNKAPSDVRKIQLEGEMNEILATQGGLTEGEAIEGFVRIEVPQGRLNLSGLETIPFDHAVDRLIRTKFTEIPILRLETINKVKSEDSKTIERVNRIINKSNIKIEGKTITAKEFAELQRDVYERATQPLVLPTTD